MDTIEVMKNILWFSISRPTTMLVSGEMWGVYSEELVKAKKTRVSKTASLRMLYNAAWGNGYTVNGMKP